MITRLCVLIAGGFLCFSSLAATVLSKNISITENQGVYTTRTSAIIQGNYDKYIDRMMDVRNFREMGVPFVQDARIVRDGKKHRVVWSHMYSFPIRAKYYVDINYHRGAKETKVNYSMVPKRGPYPDSHPYEFIKGAGTVKKISGTGDATRFQVSSVSYLKFKPGAFSIDNMLRDKLREQASGSLSVFADESS